MIDRTNPNPHAPEPADYPGPGSPLPPEGAADLYDDLFGQPPATPSTPPSEWSYSKAVPTEMAAAAEGPPSPTTLADCGLTLMQICDLILKQLYLQGNLLGIQVARHARLPFQVIDEALRFLKDERCIEVASGDMIGPASYRFNLTELGRRRAREAFDQCRYVGPAPVPLSAYVAQCRRQTVTGTACSPDALKLAFGEMIIRENLLEELGPAICSGKSIFVYGPPGNGKTMIAKGLGNFLDHNGGDIYVPYAIDAEHSIITIFDPTIHHPTDQADLLNQRPVDLALDAGASMDPNHARGPVSTDLRWRRVRRPVVMTGGELTLDMLDLRYNKVSNFYTAPLHIKANCGVFLIDDFGRQLVSPRDLLNRWILPLEERVDFLTLATGKKFSVPFEQLIIFSTNLDPRELVDEAFLRRIRHKIRIGPPDRELFTDIFKLCCQQRQLQFNPAAVEYLFSKFYDQGKPPRASDARDLLEIVVSICRFRNQQSLLTQELLAEATERFFCQI